MKRILVIGSSPCGVKALELIREKDKESQIDFICTETSLPYRREDLAFGLESEINPQDYYYRPEEFYRNNKVNVINDKAVSRINIKRKRVWMEDKSQMEFDILILTDLPTLKWIDVKGAGKTGSYNLHQISSVAQLEKQSIIAETILIQSDSMFGFQAALSLAKRKKDVLLIRSKNTIIPEIDHVQCSESLGKLLMDNHVQVCADNAIQEILGDAELMAVRLKSNKVYSTQLVLWEETVPDYKIISDLAETEPSDQLMDQWRNEGVYICEDLFDNTCIKTTQYYEDQGRQIAQHILGENILPEEFHSQKSLSIEGVKLEIFGKIEPGDDLLSEEFYSAEPFKYQKHFYKDDRLYCAIAINWNENSQELIECIRTKSGYESIRSALMQHEKSQLSENAQDETSLVSSAPYPDENLTEKPDKEGMNSVPRESDKSDTTADDITPQDS